MVFQGGHFWLEDLAVPLWLFVPVLIGAPAVVMLTTIVSLRRVQFSPLEISRRGRRRPSAWAALPLAVGLGGQLALGLLRGTASGQALDRLVPLIALLEVVGFVLVGPWLCMVVGRGVARISRGVPGLIAARRIALDPAATFRAVVGVVLAAWVITFIGSTVDQFGEQGTNTFAAGLRPGVVHVFTGGVAAEKVAPLLSDQAVTTRFAAQGHVVSCAELARVRHVSCPHAEDSGQVEPGPGSESLPVVSVDIPTDGTLATENRVRTQAANLVPNAIINTDRDPNNDLLYFADLGRLASVAGLFVLLVGACSLTAGMIGGLLERRRPFALLRASGMRIGELRRVVFLETAATMMFTSAVGVGLGLLTAYAAVRQGSMAWHWPSLDVFAYVGGGVLAALAFSMLGLPLLNAATRHDAVRFE